MSLEVVIELAKEFLPWALTAGIGVLSAGICGFAALAIWQQRLHATAGVALIYAASNASLVALAVAAGRDVKFGLLRITTPPGSATPTDADRSRRLRDGSEPYRGAIPPET